MVRIITITPVAGTDGRHRFRVALELARRPFSADLSPVDLQYYQHAQREILAQTGLMLAELNCEGRPPEMADWMWRDVAGFHLKRWVEAAAPAAASN